MYTAVKCTASARILPRIRSDAKRAFLLAISTVTHALARKGKNLGPSQVKSSQVKLDFEFNSVLILVFPVERRFRHEPSFWSLRVEARLFVLDMKTRRVLPSQKNFPPTPSLIKPWCAGEVMWRATRSASQTVSRGPRARGTPRPGRLAFHPSCIRFTFYTHSTACTNDAAHTGQWPHAYTSD
jgi:hypothetical protein